MSRLVPGAVPGAVLLACLAPGSSAAQAIPPRAGPTPALDAYMAPLVELQVFSGNITVARGDAVMLQRSYGMADVEHAIPLTPESVFRIASVSKSFTRVLVGRLADRNILPLDAPVARWLPALPSAGTITVRMLLDHRSGIPSVNSLAYDEEGLEPNTLARLVDSISARPLEFVPGTRARYSNGGYAVLARLIELAGGAPYEVLLEREVLRPLALGQTRHQADGAVIPGLAAGYMPSPSVAGELVRAPFQEMNTKAGGGSLVSSAGDLIRWARSIGRSDLLTQSRWAELFPGKDSLIAFDGRSPGFNVAVTHDRRRDLTTVVLANNYAAGMVADVAAAAAAIASGRAPDSLSVRRPAAPDPAELRALAGRYRLPDGALPLPPGSSVELRMVGGHLVAYLGPMAVDVLVPQGNGTYLARGLWSLVEPERAAGEVTAINVRALYRDTAFRAARAGEGGGT